MDTMNEILQNQDMSSDNNDEKSLMTELVRNSRRQLFHARVRTLTSTVTAGAIVICLIAVVPTALRTANQANAVMAQANTIMEQASETITFANAAIESITEMSGAITDMGENMDTFITENAESVAAVMAKIEAVDFEGLNNAIEDLGAVIEPLAKFFKKF